MTTSILISRPNVFIRNIRQLEAFNPCKNSATIVSLCNDTTHLHRSVKINLELVVSSGSLTCAPAITSVLDEPAVSGLSNVTVLSRCTHLIILDDTEIGNINYIVVSDSEQLCAYATQSF